MYDEGRDPDGVAPFMFGGRGVAVHSSCGVRGVFCAMLCGMGDPAGENDAGDCIPGCGRAVGCEMNGGRCCCCS